MNFIIFLKNATKREMVWGEAAEGGRDGDLLLHDVSA